MATIYDLSVSLRPDNMETTNLSLTPVSHEEAARIFSRRYGVKVTDIPHGSFFSNERISLRSHLGTHLDAPIHFYPTSEGRPAKTIDEVGEVGAHVGSFRTLTIGEEQTPQAATWYAPA